MEVCTCNPYARPLRKHFHHVSNKCDCFVDDPCSVSVVIDQSRNSSSNCTCVLNFTIKFCSDPKSGKCDLLSGTKILFVGVTITMFSAISNLLLSNSPLFQTHCSFFTP